MFAHSTTYYCSATVKYIKLYIILHVHVYNFFNFIKKTMKDIKNASHFQIIYE